MYSGIKIAVIGDYMHDYWYNAKSVKLAPAYPIIDCVNPEMVRDSPGGAGNVVNCIQSLGATASLFAPLTQRNLHKKHRYMYQNHLMFRVSEHPDVAPRDPYTEAKLLCDTIDEYQGVIIADYNKGCMMPETIDMVMDTAMSHGVCVYVDPKFDNWVLYEGATIFKCNAKEWIKCHRRIPTVPPYSNLVITQGADGMVVATKEDQWDKYSQTIPGRHVDVADPTGAGDVCIAVMALEYWRTEGDILKTCHVANIAGSIAVSKQYTSIVTVDELREAGAWDE